MSVKRAGSSLTAALRTVLLSHSISLPLLLLLLSLRHDAPPPARLLVWGLAAGLFGGTSVLCFYLCLARGAMGASAAISGLLAAAIPSVVSSALEGAPRPLHLVGFLLAAGAIWLIAASPEIEPSPSSTLLLSLAAGTGFGLYFVALRMAGAAGVVWPLALSRSVSISVCLIGLLYVARAGASGHTAGPPSHAWLSRSSVQWALVAALLDTSGNLLFIAASRAGRLDVAAVLASLYPASTILLAAWILHERPRRQQAIGMALATAAVVLITL